MLRARPCLPPRGLVGGGLVVLAGLLTGALPARADGERAASLAAGWAAYAVPDPDEPEQDLTSLAGAGLGAEFELALGEAFSLRADLAGAAFWGDDGASYLGLASAGGTYRFDVLRYVPYAFAGVGAVVSGGGPLDLGVSPVLVLGGGLDVLTRRERSWGVEGRLASFAGDVTVFTAGVRLTHRWGFF